MCLCYFLPALHVVSSVCPGTWDTAQSVHHRRSELAGRMADSIVHSTIILDNTLLLNVGMLLTHTCTGVDYLKSFFKIDTKLDVLVTIPFSIKISLLLTIWATVSYQCCTDTLLQLSWLTLIAVTAHTVDWCTHSVHVLSTFLYSGG